MAINTTNFLRSNYVFGFLLVKMQTNNRYFLELKKDNY